jgi:hypothetical protein
MRRILQAEVLHYAPAAKTYKLELNKQILHSKLIDVMTNQYAD